MGGRQKRKHYGNSIMRQHKACSAVLGLDAARVWDTGRAFQHLHALGKADTKRTAERRLHELGVLPAELSPDRLEDELGRKPIPAVLKREIDQARSRRKLVLYAQLFPLPDGTDCLHANDARGARYWLPLTRTTLSQARLEKALHQLQQHLGKDLVVLPHGRITRYCRKAAAPAGVRLGLLAYAPALDLESQRRPSRAPRTSAAHLDSLQAESMHILREAVAEADNPVMLYSMGKDSSVMLQLARKAFHPSRPPFPLLHVDTRWKFQEMYQFRDAMARASGMDLLVHINPEALAKGINPFDHGSVLHTDITKTQGLKQALDKYKFDVVIGGARRDEETSRAKERIFSLRTKAHRWDPQVQRPELWNLYNTRKSPGESMRVFPLSNWTELDIWQYIQQENIPVAPLYFARERPVVVREGMILLVDDARMRLLPGEQILAQTIRFRSLGCYPLTGAIRSSAGNPAEILLELAAAISSERRGRAVDSNISAGMEKRKQEGYF